VSDSTLGLYLHVPFCERVCPYCDFAVVAAPTLTSSVETRYVRALQAELDLRAPKPQAARLASLYFGGGTPSLLSPQLVAQLVEAATERFAADPAELEVTLEVNPSTVERERLPHFRAAGVNRLSVGIQSFEDEVLQGLGRAHKATEGRETVRAARRAGFTNLSVDLLFAAPRQSFDSLERDLAEVVELAPEHVSTYELIIEPGTPFELAARRGQLRRPDEDTIVAMLERVDARLLDAGYLRYELASYAQPGFEAVHNSRYWRREPVLGLGLGAFSNESPSSEAPYGLRRSNTRDLANYLARLEAGELPEVETEVFDVQVARGEAVFLALRRSQGLEAAAFEAEFGAAPRALYGDEIEGLLRTGLLAENPRGDLRLTARGRLLADTVGERFV
jgi:oxygen-independent coproporphyrinogen-3 oxidase